jgi:hypothetical protein
MSLCNDLTGVSGCIKCFAKKALNMKNKAMSITDISGNCRQTLCNPISWHSGQAAGRACYFQTPLQQQKQQAARN